LLWTRGVAARETLSYLDRRGIDAERPYVGYHEIYDLVHGRDFISGRGDEGYRANVRTFIKRIRKRFRDSDPSFEEIENYAGSGTAGRRMPDMVPDGEERIPRSGA
jgi:two-component system response regulator ChvI